VRYNNFKEGKGFINIDYDTLTVNGVPLEQMEAGKIRTCRYCEYLGENECPYYPIRWKFPRKVDDPSCSQFIALKDVSRFKERAKIDQVAIEKKKIADKIKGPLKRSIEL
jgi:hypothetical protein